MIKRNLLLCACAAVLFGCGGSHAVVPGGDLRHSAGEVQPFVRQTGQQPANWEEFDAGPYDGSNDLGIVQGPDGNMWFTDAGGSIGNVSMAGVITKYQMPSPNNYPEYIVKGPASTLWFNEQEGHIGRITLSGAVTEFLIPIPKELTLSITRGPDGDFWFSEEQPQDLQPMIGRVSPTGTFRQPFNVLGGYGMTTGPDGRVWFTQQNRTSIGALTTSGQYTSYSGLHEPAIDVVSGPNGKLWFTESDYIGRITTNGSITEFPNVGYYMNRLTVGPDNHLWFTTVGRRNYIGRMSLSGEVQMFLNPFGSNEAREEFSIAVGPDNNIWFTSSDDFIGVRIRLVLTIQPSSVSFSRAGQTQTITVTEKNYNGQWTAASLNPSVATAAPGSMSNTFTITSVGPGSTSVDVADMNQNDFLVPVTVP